MPTISGVLGNYNPVEALEDVLKREDPYLPILTVLTQGVTRRFNRARKVRLPMGRLIRTHCPGSACPIGNLDSLWYLEVFPG